MKTFSVAVAVAIMLAFICIQESSADPITGVQEPEEPKSNDNPVAEHQELPGRLGKMLSNIREKRQSNCCHSCHGNHCQLCHHCCSHGHCPSSVQE
ncbi:hepcidin-like isoform X1 [Centropristis striata]|uniref:hepcidin-like isoform X1 n=1 Tax=Centropristis striata TaxID=184440 RepID=UPI0027DF86F4|nr:hepcidin-like isoform X1 [Centropristis striata]